MSLVWLMREGRFNKKKCFKIDVKFLLKEKEKMLLKIYSKITIQLYQVSPTYNQCLQCGSEKKFCILGHSRIGVV